VLEKYAEFGEVKFRKHGPMFIINIMSAQFGEWFHTMLSMCVHRYLLNLPQNAATEMMRFIRTHSLCFKTMAPFSKGDKVLIKEYNAGQFVTEFLNKVWTKSTFICC